MALLESNMMNKSVLTKEMTIRVFWIFLFVSTGSVNFGFDLTWWNSALGTPQFVQEYGVSPGLGQEKVIPSSWQSIGSGTPTAGLAIGTFVGGYINGRLGRRVSIAVLAVVAAVGIILQVSIPSYWGVIAGRIINSISMGMETNVIPVYSAELAPPAIRGFVINLYQWWQIVGNILAASCMYGTTRHLTGQWSYKTVMVLQIVIPTILFIGVWFLPESPRWLLQKERNTEALNALKSVRTGSHATEADIKAEFELIRTAVVEQKEFHLATSVTDCFKGTNFRRTMIATMMQVLQAAQGNAFITIYYNVFLQQIGIENSQKWFIVSNLLQLVGISFSFYLPDKFGRRPVLFIGSVLMALFMYLVAGLATFQTSPDGSLPKSTASGCVCAIILWYFVNGGAWGSGTWITVAEVPTSQLREKTVFIAAFSGFVVDLIIQYVNPYVQDKGYGNLGSRVGFIYGSMSVLSMVWIALFLPEMRGRSLEELDELFQNKISARKFGSHECVGIGNRITEMQDSNAGGTKVAEPMPSEVFVHGPEKE